MNTQEGMINIRRLRGTGDRFYEDKPYEILLDEEQLGSLNINEYRNYHIAAGDHSIQVSYTLLFPSEILRFKLRPGDTLEFECGGQPGIPQPFVRKVLPKPLKTGPSQVLPPAMRPDARDHIFMSYRRSDSADVLGRIYDRLVDRFGREVVFKDVDSIPLGVNFKEYLDAKVSECKVLLAIIGMGWVNARDSQGNVRLNDPKDIVRVEIESALKRKIRVIPLLVGGASMPLEEELRPSLRELTPQNGIQIRSDPDFHKDMNRLISSLETYIPLPKK